MANNGNLFKMIKRRKGLYDPATIWELCVPKTKRSSVLAEDHDESTAGHFGIKNTVAIVGQNPYWPGWKKYVIEYIRKCTVCQRHNPHNKNRQRVKCTSEDPKVYGIL